MVGELGSNAGLCTLWSEKERILTGLRRSDYAVCGNLYSLWGLNYLLRNVLANPRIRYLVVCGADLSGSGEALCAFFERGVDAGHRVLGSAARIEGEMPHEALALVRRSVKLVDLRGNTDSAKVVEALRGLAPLEPFAEPRVFPQVVPKAETLPSEKSGFKVSEPTVAGAWLRLLHLVMEFGEVKPSEYAQEQKELLNAMAVVTGEDPRRIALKPWLPLDQGELERYYPQMLSGQRSEEEAALGIRYTYGERLRSYRGRDQVREMVERLRATSHSRRAIAVTWDPEEDPTSPHPPCLTQLLASVQGGRLYLTAHFRSHDIYGAWPQNAYALRRLQGEMAGEVGVGLGPLAIVSHSAHIYADKWQAARELVEAHHPRKLAWRDDPRGNFHISLKGGLIMAEHATTEGGPTGRVFRGKSARSVYLQIAACQLVSLTEHAAYLGAELEKAELALRYRLPYRQDTPFKLTQQE